MASIYVGVQSLHDCAPTRPGLEHQANTRLIPDYSARRYSLFGEMVPENLVIAFEQLSGPSAGPTSLEDVLSNAAVVTQYSICSNTSSRADNSGSAGGHWPMAQ